MTNSWPIVCLLMVVSVSRTPVRQWRLTLHSSRWWGRHELQQGAVCSPTGIGVGVVKRAVAVRGGRRPASVRRRGVRWPAGRVDAAPARPAHGGAGPGRRRLGVAVGIDGWKATLLGLTKPVTPTLVRFKCGSNPVTKKDRCGGNAVGQFKRARTSDDHATAASSSAG